MKVSECREIITDLENQIKSISELHQIHDLNESYAKLKNNSGYFFSDFEPNDIYEGLSNMLCDLSAIAEDLQNVINTHGESLEV